MKTADLLIVNASELVVLYGSKSPRRGREMSELGVINDGALAIRNGKISAVGVTSAIKNEFKTSKTIDAKGKVVTPGLIDAHTHLIFAGSREKEFELRIKGTSYLDIAKAGGGINATVEKVRKTSKKELKAIAKRRLAEMLKLGTTTAEVKSGYGLNLDDEIKCLEIVKELNKEQPITIVPTFMGAHDVPPEFKNRTGEYVNFICDKVIPIIAKKKLAKFCDIFCEDVVFDIAESRQVLTTAKKFGLIPKIHADEFKPIGGTELAVELEASSAEHLLNITDRGILALKNSSTIAVLMPATAFFLGGKYAPARRLMEENIPVAIASDFNPGSSMTYNMQLVMTIACTQMKMLPSEALTAATINAAHSLLVGDKIGSLEPGKAADIVIWDAPSYRYISYHFGENHVWAVIKNGKRVV